MKTYAFALAMIVVAGCHKDNNYCPGANPDNSCAEIDAKVADGCSSNATCTAPKAVCDLAGSKTCVQCVAPDDTSACTATSPVCGNDHTCRGCTAHTDCPVSDVCLPDGSCADTSVVAYVAPTGTDNTSCTKATPCTKVAKALATSRPYVKFTGTTDEQVSINNQNATLLADPGAKLTYTTGTGILLKIDGTSVVSIFDLEIADALGTTGASISLQNGNTATVTLQRVKIDGNGGAGVTASGGTLTVTQSTISGNTGGGITASGGGTLTVTQSTISGNTGGGITASGGGTLTVTQSTISGNTGGGITVGAGTTFILVGNIFFLNGNGSASVGGVSIMTSQSTTNRLEFNSFNKNTTQDGVASAIYCVAGTFTARNNILSGNGTQTQLDQTGGSCTHAYSIVRPGALPAGTGNSAADPLFVNTTTGDLHIQTSSPAHAAADPSSNLTGVAAKDLDGDPRVAPADIGADQLP